MAASVEAKIVEGFLEYFRGILLPPGVVVAYPNAKFTKPAGLPYVRLTIAKNTPETMHIGGGKEPRRQGIFLAVVCWPVNQGIINATELAAVIRDRFAYNTQIVYQGVTIWIDEEPSVQTDEQGDTHTEIPVVVPWHVYP